MKRLREKTLLVKIRTDKDSQAFAELYDLYIEKIYRFVAFKVSNRTEVEDLVSEIFLKTWNYLINKETGTVQNFSGLVYKIARTKIIDHYRDKSRIKETSIEQIGDVGEESKEVIRIDLQTDMDNLLKNIKKLKQEYQDVVILKYIEELSTNEISKIMEKSRANVRVTLHRALKLLKEMSN